MFRLQRFANQLQPNACACPWKQQHAQQQQVVRRKAPVNVVVTGAAGNIGYAIVFMIAQGSMLGLDQPVNLRLLDIPPMAQVLEGLVMELKDGAFPVLHSIVATTDYQAAFDSVDIALLVGAKPRGPGMQRGDLLKANASIFAGQGEALNKWAKSSVKVLVVGNPANTNAMIARKHAPRLHDGCFAALTRLDENRALAQIADRLKVQVAQIRNLIIWGNHSSTQYPDVNHAYVQDYPAPGLKTSVRSAVNDDEWLHGVFLSTVQERGAAIIKARGKSSAASAASAAVDCMRDWCLGTPRGEWRSVAVPSDGSYGIPKGIVFSFPVRHVAGQSIIVRDLPLDEFSKGKIAATTQELLSEREAALNQQ